MVFCFKLKNEKFYYFHYKKNRKICGELGRGLFYISLKDSEFLQSRFKTHARSCTKLNKNFSSYSLIHLPFCLSPVFILNCIPCTWFFYLSFFMFSHTHTRENVKIHQLFLLQRYERKVDAWS